MLQQSKCIREYFQNYKIIKFSFLTKLQRLRERKRERVCRYNGKRKKAKKVKTKFEMI